MKRSRFYLPTLAVTDLPIDNPPIDYLFKPHYPFHLYRSGVIVRDSKTLRRIALLQYVSDDNDKASGVYNHSVSVPYARYLCSFKEKRFPTLSEHADHSDNDRFNDCMSNIQLLKSGLNQQKQARFVGRCSYIITCAICSKFMKRHVDVSFQKFVLDQDSQAITCSRECVKILRYKTILPNEIQQWIKYHQILYMIREHDFVYEDWYGEFYPHIKIENIRSVDETECFTNGILITHVRKDFSLPMGRYGGIEHLQYILPFELNVRHGSNIITPSRFDDYKKKEFEKVPVVATSYLS